MEHKGWEEFGLWACHAPLIPKSTSGICKPLWSIMVQRDFPYKSLMMIKTYVVIPDVKVIKTGEKKQN